MKHSIKELFSAAVSLASEGQPPRIDWDEPSAQFRASPALIEGGLQGLMEMGSSSSQSQLEGWCGPLSAWIIWLIVTSEESFEPVVCALASLKRNDFEQKLRQFSETAIVCLHNACSTMSVKDIPFKRQDFCAGRLFI